MISPLVDKPKKNEPSYSTTHIVKRKKLLLGNVACLTMDTVCRVIALCASQIAVGLAPSYILASIFTGRTLSQLLEARIAIPSQHVDEQRDIGFYILSNWQHPELKLPIRYLNLFHKPEKNGETLLPLELLPSFQKSRHEQTTFEELKTEIDLFCKQNFFGLYQHVNLNRIQNHFSHCAPKFGLSRADVAFIADYNLQDHPHCSYGIFDTRAVLQKHVQYIGSLTAKVGISCLEVNPLDKKSYFGSHRVLKDSSVIAFFTYCVQQINRNPATHAELVQSFNFYTFYVVSFLELCTLHRPALMEFGKADNFDVVTGSVVICDKGEQSSRVIPLCESACTILKAYVNYLKNLMRDLRFTYPEVANTIAKSLNCETSLFQFWDSRGITAYHPNLMYSLIKSIFPFPLNWPRHYIATLLINEGVPRNKLEVFMGHAPSPDEIYNDYSSFDFNNNRVLSDKIEKYITQELNLPIIA